MRVRTLTCLAAAAALAVGITGCGSSGGGSGPEASGSQGKVVVGSAGFTEIDIMANMYKLLLDKAGFDASVQVVQNRELYEPALENGQIDVVPDYAATMAEFLNHKVNGKDAAPVASSDIDATMKALRKLAGPLGLTALEPAQAVDQNAYAVSKDFAKQHNLTTLSDLGNSGIGVRLAGPEECPTRQFCQIALEKVYNIKITGFDPLGFSTAQVKQAVKTDKDQLGVVGSTDGTLSDFNLVILKDDKHSQNADNLVPVVGKKYADNETFAAALNKLSSVLTTDDLAALNVKVDQDRQKAEDVARDYLKSKGLL